MALPAVVPLDTAISIDNLFAPPTHLSGEVLSLSLTSRLSCLPACPLPCFPPPHCMFLPHPLPLRKAGSRAYPVFSFCRTFVNQRNFRGYRVSVLCPSATRRGKACINCNPTVERNLCPRAVIVCKSSSSSEEYFWLSRTRLFPEVGKRTCTPYDAQHATRQFSAPEVPHASSRVRDPWRQSPALSTTYPNRRTTLPLHDPGTREAQRQSGGGQAKQRGSRSPQKRQ